MNTLQNMTRNAKGLALAAAAALLLGACAAPLPPPPPPQSYVALLPSPDGSIGKVVVQGQRGEQVLTQAQQGALLDGSQPPFAVSAERLQRDFGAAMQARPALPEQFLLYFETGGLELTAESKALLARIVERALARTSLDMSVIGHTDTQGAAATNEALALKRATAIAEQLRGLGLKDAQMSIESHGERNLLVPTPDETAEPRNRRVEITLR
jgi:adhesin transport system outer membrane protein